MMRVIVMCWILPYAVFILALMPSYHALSSTSMNRRFEGFRSPYLAIITETTACDSAENVDSCFRAMELAVQSGCVELVSVRVPFHKDNEATMKPLVLNLTTRLVDLAKNQPRASQFLVVVTSDWADVGIQAQADGIHVKEKHLDRIPTIRQAFLKKWGLPPVIGTSTHSLASATSSYDMYQPDYYFCGTCYLTQSHPEKDEKDLEGPALSGQVATALRERGTRPVPLVLAIGGIDTTNCHEPVLRYGADGVATIRAVLAASDPCQAALNLGRAMGKTGMCVRHC